MIKTKMVPTTEEEIVSKVCDKCKVDVEKYSLDNEVVSIRHEFGYGTELDGTIIEFEVCKNCFMEMIKDIDYRKKGRGGL